MVLVEILANSKQMNWLWMCLVAPSLVAATLQNKTTSEKGERTGRQAIGVFNVVKFPNDACGGTNNLNGTCYTASECTSKGGSSQGACASGFGVCCTFSLSCGGSASENNTYAIVTTYSTSTDADPCIYSFCKTSSDICKLRIDFEIMTVAVPYALPTVTTDPNGVYDGLQSGKCTTDVVSITNPGGKAPPTICGVNTGQHMFIDASDSCNDIKIDIDTGVSNTRAWQIKVTQYTCSSQNIPVQNCLQWHTGTSGTFYGFAWEVATTAITSSSHIHLQSQYYDICFRRERGYCSLCFTPQIYSVIAATSWTSYGVSGASDGAGKSAIDSLCGLSAAIAASPIHADYIEVYNLQPSIGTTNTVGAQRICGTVWNSAATAVIHAAAAAAYTSCTWSTPFKFGVRFDAQEATLKSPVAATAQNTAENALGALGGGWGLTGFYMAFWQNVC